jgi:hypothetical protein
MNDVEPKSNSELREARQHRRDKTEGRHNMKIRLTEGDIRLAKKLVAAHFDDPAHDEGNCERCQSNAAMRLGDEWLDAADRFKDDLMAEVFRLKAKLDYLPDWPVVLNSAYETVNAIRKVLGPWRNTDWDPEMMMGRPDLVGRPDLAIQTWVLKPEYRVLFSAQELARAREGLRFRIDENRVARIARDARA